MRDEFIAELGRREMVVTLKGIRQVNQGGSADALGVTEAG